jgi:hypothetical protein
MRTQRLIFLLVTAFVFPLSYAQDTDSENSTVVYPASYFSDYAPVTAQDMMDRIPGLTQTTGGSGVRGGQGSGRSRGGGGAGGRRGLGDGAGANQILINGKRTAGKTNQASTQLSRIASELVDYIEIIRNTSGDLDVRGSGQVINVVLFEQLSTSSMSYEVNMDRYWDGEAKPGGSFSYSGEIGNLDFLFSGQAVPRYDFNLSKENSVLGDYSPNDRVREERTREQTSYEYSMNLDYSISDSSSVRFNALTGLNDSDTDVDRWTTDLRPSPNPLEIEREALENGADNWEIGGDYEYNFANGNRFKILFITNESDDGQLRERFDVLVDSEEKNLFLDTFSQNQERIVRTSFNMDLLEGQDIEFGVERAQTILNSKLSLATNSSSGTPSADHGGLVPVAISNANSKVEEIRIEPFLVHNWTLNSRMSLESTVKYESSEIEQTGDVYNKRSFDFLKPKVDYRFNITPVLQLRGTIEKTVSQLSFRDFVAASDFNDNDSEVQAGNVQLRQEEAWQYDLNIEYRLPNDVGVVDASIFYYDLENVIERIDVSPSPTQLDSANGNIGDGQRYGLLANASIRLGIINLPNVLATSRFTLEKSKVTDPFLGISRRADRHPRGSIIMGFRHDIPRFNLNYGLNWNNRFDSNRKRFDLEDIELDAVDPLWDAFAEVILFGDVTVRLDARRFIVTNFCRERQRFVGAISSGIIEEIEDSCNTSGRTLALKVTGTF